MTEPDTPDPVPDTPLPGGAVMRLVRPSDAPALLAAYSRNAAHLAPTEPLRGERFATLEGQAERIAGQLREWEAGRTVPWVLDGSGVPGAHPVLGTLTFTGIVRGPLLSASVGQGVASDPVRCPRCPVRALGVPGEGPRSGATWAFARCGESACRARRTPCGI
ncbi:hypothetical protein ABZ853_19105 [Streptomyces albidoflavus]